jgi:hypothetical protein
MLLPSLICWRYKRNFFFHFDIGFKIDPRMQQAPFNNYANDDIKLTDVIRSFSNYSKFILKKFWIVIIGAALVGAAGYFYCHHG